MILELIIYLTYLPSRSYQISWQQQEIIELPREPEELKGQKQVCSSLRESLESLESDSTFLTTGGVFTQDQINAYMKLKWEEVYDLEHSPHPVEFQNYYSV